MPASAFKSRCLCLVALGVSALAAGCAELGPSGDPSAHHTRRGPLKPGEHLPDASEADSSGPLQKRIRRDSPEWKRLVRCQAHEVVFKDEERSGADRMMTPRLERSLRVLGDKVEERWPGVQLRVTEAWDEDNEHSAKSLHYEGRAADITTSDLDRTKYGTLAQLAASSGFDWVYFENASHVHVSVRAD